MYVIFGRILQEILMRFIKPLIGIAFISSLIWAIPAHAADPDSSKKAQELIDKGLAYLKSQQKPDGSWQTANDQPALTAIALKAFLGDSKNYNAQSPLVEKGFTKLLTYQQPNGGIYKDMIANYNTSIAISALSAAGDKKYQSQVEKAVAFLKALQWNNNPAELNERKAVEDSDPRFGGWGYGRKERPDMSNLQVAMDALKDAGLNPSDPAYQNAIKFITRSQNLSETNDQPWASNDGGFIYTPALGGESMAGEYTGPDGKKLLRSYGSMTYAGLKSMIYAGLTKDDQRVKAAFEWISKNWTVDENPGMKSPDPAAAGYGLYYYFHTLARSLSAYGQPTITDPQGKSHDWRIELIDKLATLQKPDGSWVGEKKWMEDNPVLVTAYAVIALEHAEQDLAARPIASAAQ